MGKSMRKFRGRITVVAGAALLAAGCAEAPAETASAPSDQSAPASDAAPSSKAWALDPAQSRVSFVSIKAGEVAEVHRFTSLEGDVEADGAATVIIALDGVETNIDIRNERMRTLLFETETYPRATISSDIDLSQYDALDIGERVEATATLRVDLHGVEGSIDANLFVTRIDDGAVAVETAGPVLVEASAFDLAAGVEALREVAGLPSITPVVPVTASLVFRR